MAKISLFNKIILIIIIFCIVINCKESKKSKKKEKKEKAKKVIKEEKVDILKFSLEWAKNNSIYINNKLTLTKKTDRNKYYFFTADSRIFNNTLLLRVPYDMMITQFSLNEIYKNSKNKKFENLWDKINSTNSEYIKYFSTKQLLYMALLLENSIRKKKGPIYKKYKEYLRMYEEINMDIYPVFYDMQERLFLFGSNFGGQLKRAIESLNEEYFISTRDLNLNIPFQEEFLKARVISIISSTDFHNSNFNYTNGFNETVIVPYLDCFNKVINKEKANARFEIKGIKNETTNLIDYYLEVYSNDDIFIGGEINLQWRPFPNSEFLLYYGMIEEDNPYNSKYYADILTRIFRKDLNISEDRKFQKDVYELNTEFYESKVIDCYRNISLELDKYKGREEGPYELMQDNLKSYKQLYEVKLSDGNINMYINGKEKIKDIKEIIHTEKRLIKSKIEYLENVINEIKKRNKEGKNENKNDKKENNKEDL